MEIFNKFKHTSLISSWWLRDPILATTLMLDRKYNLPSDWVVDLERAKAIFTTNGLIEIVDILRGEREKIAEVFLYTPDRNKYLSLEIEAYGLCFQRGIDKIKIKMLSIADEYISKDDFIRKVSFLNEIGGRDVSKPMAVGDTKLEPIVPAEPQPEDIQTVSYTEPNEPGATEATTTDEIGTVDNIHAEVKPVKKKRKRKQAVSTSSPGTKQSEDTSK